MLFILLTSYMYINNNVVNTYILQINLQVIEKLIIEIQQKIYKSSSMCEVNNIYKYQKDFLLKKEFFLIFIKKVLYNIKKKLVLLNLI